MNRRVIVLVLAMTAIVLFGTTSVILRAQYSSPDDRTDFINNPLADQYSNPNSIPKTVVHSIVDFGNLPENSSISEDQWHITLSGMSDTPQGYQYSDVKIIDGINQDALRNILPEEEPVFDKCMGIRIHFDKSYNNDWARIHPRLPISDFTLQDNTTPTGMIEAVGYIKRVSCLVRGLNYRHSLELRMKNERDEYYNVVMGGLYFSGWKRLVWSNPDYVMDIGKRDIMKRPLYPQYAPFLKFDSLMIYKAPGEVGGDFVLYIKDIQVEYEPYPLGGLADIPDEDVWEIQYNEAALELEHDINMLEFHYQGSTFPEDQLEQYEQNMINNVEGVRQGREDGGNPSTQDSTGREYNFDNDNNQ